MLAILLAFTLTAPPPKLEILELKAVRQPKDKSVLEDICSHTLHPHGNSSGRNTNAHETTHQIASDIRNLVVAERMKLKNTKRSNAFYLLNGKYCVVDEPNIKITQIREFIPKELQGGRFHYFTDQRTLKDWNEYPLYIADEWNAYINGAASAVYDGQNVILNEPVRNNQVADGISGALEFSIYMAALSAAVQKYDSAYWTSNVQFHEFVQYNMNRAQDTYEQSYKVKGLNWNRLELHELFKMNPAAQDLRNILLHNYQSVWLMKSFAPENKPPQPTLPKGSAPVPSIKK